MERIDSGTGGRYCSIEGRGVCGTVTGSGAEGTQMAEKESGGSASVGL